MTDEPEEIWTKEEENIDIIMKISEKASLNRSEISQIEEDA